MADIFDEVSEDLRQDQILQVWRKYSKFIIGFITLTIISVFGFQGYNSWNKNQLNLKSEHFFNALDKLEEEFGLEIIFFYLRHFLNKTGEGAGGKFN